jgi:glycosyltransferase involved in cell wall biosynthesis
MPMLLHEHPDLRLLLGGGGPEEQSLREQARNLAIERKVVFVGRVPQHEVPRYCSLVDLFAFPRLAMRLTETVTPLKPLEAMAQGKPVVASNVGGHRELIRDGKTGYLFRADSVEQLASCLRDVLGRRGEWPLVGAAGRLFVESERSWVRSVAGYTTVYQTVLQTRAAA